MEYIQSRVDPVNRLNLNNRFILGWFSPESYTSLLRVSPDRCSCGTRKKPYVLNFPDDNKLHDMISDIPVIGFFRLPTKLGVWSISPMEFNIMMPTGKLKGNTIPLESALLHLANEIHQADPIDMSLPDNEQDMEYLITVLSYYLGRISNALCLLAFQVAPPEKKKMVILDDVIQLAKHFENEIPPDVYQYLD